MKKFPFFINLILLLTLIFVNAWSLEITAKAGDSNSLNKISHEDEPMGFASLNGGTTGGAGGDTITVTSAQQLADIMKPREKNVTDPIVIFVSGTLTGFEDMLDIKRTANVSLLGLGDSAGFQGFGIKIVESSNIVVRNLTFADCTVEEKDGLTITEESNNIWIDHCTFTDSPASDPNGDDHDGLLDIKHGSYNITISNNYFTNHRKTALFGHSENETSDVNMKATYYCNWFDGTYSRHPRTRYGKVHMLNNLYTGITGYGVGVTCAAQVMLEGNFFENTVIPTLISQVNDPDETLSGDPEGYLKAVSNFTVNSGAIVENLNGYYFDPHNYYEYTVIDSQEVKGIVQSMAGAGKIDIGTSIQNEISNLPVDIILNQNYPNPFNPVTTINYMVGAQNLVPQRVDLSIYNTLGQKVVTLVNKKQPAGSYKVEWNASEFPTGIFYCILKSKSFQKSIKMILIK